MNGGSNFKAETTGLFAVRIISNCLLIVSLDAAFGLLFKLPPILILISACEMLIYLALAMLLLRRFQSFAIFSIVHFTGIFLVTFGAPYMFYVHLIEASIISSLALAQYITGRRMIYPGIAHVIFPFIIFIAGFTTDNRDLMIFSVAAETGFLVLFMLKRNFESLDNVFVSASRYVRVPYGKMKKMNMYFAVFFVLGSLLVAFILGLFFDGAQLLYLIGHGIAFVLVGIFVGIVWLFSHIFPGADSQMIGQMASQPGSIFALLEEHPILMMLWRMFEFTMYVLTFAVILYLGYKFVKDIYHEFRSAVPENGDKRVFLETREENETTEKKDKKRLGFGPDDRVRRKYIRLVRNSGKLNEITDSMTPGEIEKIVDKPELTKLHDEYEKSRYG